MEIKENPNPTLRIGIRILIVIIILAILFILSLGIIKLVPKALDGITNLKNSFSSTSTKDEILSVTTDKPSVSSGDTLTVSWTHTNIQNNNGLYAFKYMCSNSIAFASTQTGAIIPCNTDFALNASTSPTQLTYSSTGQKSVIFKVVSTGQSITDAPANVMISIDYVNPSTGGVYTTGNANVLVQNVSSTSSVPSLIPLQATSTPTAHTPTTTTYPSAPVTHTYSGPADFQVRILSKGIIDPQTNRFIAVSSFSQDEKVAMQFQISNIGGQSTGAWNFVASLPSSIPAEVNYVSPQQASLAPGGSVLYTIGFDPSVTNQAVGQNATVSVSPNSSSIDSNTSNNSATTQFTISSSNGYTGNSGLSDIAISSAQPGYIASNGQFVASYNSIPYGSTAAINLTVTNRGGSASGNWSFTTKVQSSNGYTSGNAYNSGSLSSLQAGATQSFIINLSQLGQGSNSAVINLDPNNQTQDANRSNNSATVQVYNGSYTY